ncbi:hypothetical protein L7F22_021424 [Adiantum nelumboides]|nr:hypothetical protein [Adiantum nelumboides]
MRWGKQSWHKKLGDRLFFYCGPPSVTAAEGGAIISEEAYIVLMADQEELQEELEGDGGAAFLARHPAFFLHLAGAFLLFALLASLLYLILDYRDQS